MKTLATTIALGLALSLGTAHAATEAQKAQQERMKACNKDAVGKKGDERKAFMKSCLAADKATAQQDRMKACNKEAAGKKGDERKAFMSDCLQKGA
jgi:hypothetical protein